MKSQEKNEVIIHDERKRTKFKYKVLPIIECTVQLIMNELPCNFF